MLSSDVLTCILSFQMLETSSTWNNLPSMVKPRSKDLVDQLLKSKADSTSSRYSKEIEKFCKWCKSFSVEPRPPFTVALVIAYLSKVYGKSKSYSSLVLTHSALKWFHSFLPDMVANPFDSPICHNLLEAAKRCKAPIEKKSPVTPVMIKEIIDQYGSPSANLKDLRLACLCSLGFAGFFRYNELSNILPCHLEFFPGYLKVFVPRAKNDVYREGNYVYISRLNNHYCPVVLLERYIHMADIDPTSTAALFRQVRLFKSINRYKLCGDKLSYSRCRELFKNCLKDLGYNEKLYGLHSLRSGGATAAVKNNVNLSERLLKLHGRWKSDSAKDMYILEDTSKRLAVSSHLGV